MQALTVQSLLMLIEMLNLLNNISGMTNRDVEKIGKKCLKNFKGVFPSDSKPNIKRNIKTFSVIFNLSPHNEEGSHFVAVQKNNNSIYYFDSFGQPCKNKKIKKFLATFSTIIIYNNLTIQAPKSIFCSFFCLGFLLAWQKGLSFKQFLIKFKKNLQKNDKIIENFVLKTIRQQTCKLKD